MLIEQNVSLLPLNTFGIDARAQYFTTLDDIALLPELSGLQQYGARHILGGGSNILLTASVPGLVIANRLKGIAVVQEDDASIWLKVAAGEVWHELVLYTIAQGWNGLENLALIPGTVGASPIQNIGAYGVEVKDLVTEVQGWHWADQAAMTLSNSDCRFGYRDSIFKQELKGQILVTHVVFRLYKQPQLNTAYGAIQQELEQMNVVNPTAKDIAAAVIRIRSSKLPDPKQIGNAGSFFKNPLIPEDHYHSLQQQYPEIPAYKAGEGQVKVPAGWLIETAGWKGFREGEIGVHARQALVLVNYGHADGNAIWALSDRIIADIEQRFGIVLEREVQVW
jgi:UDP-N-acetylmuramate dehydrogenase